MADFSQKFNFPSGVQLPFILRKKIEAQKAQAASEREAVTKEESPASTSAKEVTGFSLTKDQRNRILTSEELGNKIWKSTVALVEIQKQIHRGEEAYYEETFGHGSLFKGWEGFLDAKDVGATSNSKPPRDTRWFSGSSSVSRTARPPPIHTQWSAASQQPRQNSNKTPNSTVSLSQPASTSSAPRTTPMATTPSVTPVSIKAPAAAAASAPAESKPAALPPSTTNATATEAKAKDATKQPENAQAHTPANPPEAAEAAEDSFRIPKKKKKTDAAAPAATSATTASNPIPETQPTENSQTAASAQNDDAAKEATDTTSGKKSKAGRKRKSLD